jgi:hypothetical protein
MVGIIFDKHNEHGFTGHGILLVAYAAILTRIAPWGNAGSKLK